MLSSIKQRITDSGLGTFVVIWFGQLISLTGSRLTSFALGVWVYQQTGSITQFSLILVFTALPAILITPVAGIIVDRWDRRKVMILGNLGAGLSVLAISLLLLADQLAVWHIYLAVSAIALCNAVHSLAYSASISLLVPKQHLGRAGGMTETGQAIGRITAPVLAGVLVELIGLYGVILIDFATFLFALITLLIIRIPEPPAGSNRAGKGSLFRQATYGWVYIKERHGLLSLLIFFAAVNFLVEVTYALFTPLMLSFTSAAALGTLLSIAGSGSLVGGLIMSTWGGPKRRINGVIGFSLVLGLGILLAGLQPSLPLITVAITLVYLSLPIVTSSSQVLWQTKVPPELQGRVFAMRRMLGMITPLLAFLTAGTLADSVFEPLLAASGPLAGSIGQVIGFGPGRGIAFFYICMGSLLMLVSVAGYLYSPLRQVEDDLPDAIVAKPVAS
jgi:MFS family permease